MEDYIDSQLHRLGCLILIIIALAIMAIIGLHELETDSKNSIRTTDTVTAGAVSDEKLSETIELNGHTYKLEK